MGGDFVSVGETWDTLPATPTKSLPLRSAVPISLDVSLFILKSLADSWPRVRRLLGEGARRSPKSLRVGDFSGSIPSRQLSLTQNSKLWRTIQVLRYNTVQIEQWPARARSIANHV